MHWNAVIEERHHQTDSICRVCYAPLLPHFDPDKEEPYQYVIAYLWKVGEDISGSSELVTSITMVTTSAAEFYEQWLAALDGVDPTAAENN